MSQNTNVDFYVTGVDPAPYATLPDILKYFEAEDVAATLLTSPEASFDDIQRGISKDIHYEMLLQRVTIVEAAFIYSVGKLLRLMVVSPITRRLTSLVDEAIPESVRGDAWPHELTITCGRHDIYENAENTDGQLFGTAICSARFWGYSTPRDIVEYRRKVLEFPLVLEIQRQLSRFWGSTECCVYMHI